MTTKNREEGCLLEDIILEMDHMLRPQGRAIIRAEDASVMTKIADLAPKFLWDTQLHTLENDEKKMEQVLFSRKQIGFSPITLSNIPMELLEDNDCECF